MNRTMIEEKEKQSEGGSSWQRSMGAVIKILAAGFGWGIIGVFSRPLSGAGINAVQISLLRSVIVAVGMGLLLLWRDRSLFCIRLRDIWMFFGTGLLSVVLFNICYFMTIQRATLSVASILLYTAPFFVLMVSAVLFHERITVQKVAALLMAFGGCVLVSGFSGLGLKGTAILTGIGSGVGYGLYTIFGSIALKKYHAFTVIFYTFLIASAGLIPFSSIGEMGGLLTASPVLPANGLALGLVSTFLPFVLYTSGLQDMEAGRASVLAFSEPMVATIAGIAVFHEALKLQSALGIVLIFGAIVLLNVPLGRKR